MDKAERAPRLYTWLVLATALLTLGLIIFGAVVRVTDSGLGCGDDWPLCNGTIFPPLDNLTAWIEWLHRLFAALIGVVGLVTLFVGFRQRVHLTHRLSIVMVAVGALLFVVQSALGALVVVLELPPTMVALHLGTALLLLAALLAGFVAARHVVEKRYPADAVTSLVYITTALSLVIILTGALVRGSGATLACVDWPLCYGELLPASHGQLALIHVLHRFAVAALGLALVLMVWQVFQNRRGRGVRWLSVAALALYLAQSGVGAMFVISSAAPVWGAAHVGLAAGTWAILVVLSVLEYVNTHPMMVGKDEFAWQSPSEAVVN